ncbi:hypothetical protein NHX12_003814, partial [Muraenolepis orangiensis]
MEASSRKQRFKKGRSATFSIDGFNITIVSHAPSKSAKAPLNDPRSAEEILADDLPEPNGPEATEKTALRSAPAS